jgi:DNA-directed RNA polymerase subunit N (RpoN/RPB10)
MELYYEYPVRCKTCNEQIACYSYEYLEYLEQGYTIEEALNLLQIMNPCSRIAMMNPTPVFFNLENRDAVEGIRDVQAIDLDDDFIQEKLKALKDPLIISKNGKKIPQGKTQTRKPVPSLKEKTRKPVPSLKEKTITSETSRITENPYEIELKGPKIAINLAEAGNFIEPLIPGIPTINPDSIITPTIINVGGDKQTQILSGRTYIAY